MKFLFDTVNILVAELYRFFLIGKYHKYICISCVMFLSPGIFFYCRAGLYTKVGAPSSDGSHCPDNLTSQC